MPPPTNPLHPTPRPSTLHSAHVKSNPGPTRQAAADRAPPLLELCAALSSAPALAPVLGGYSSSSLEEGPSEWPPKGAKPLPPASRKAAASLLGAVPLLLANPACSGASMNAALTAVEQLLALQRDVCVGVLAPHAQPLLEGMRHVVQPGGGGRDAAPVAAKASSSRGGSRNAGMVPRGLTILEQLCELLDAGSAGPLLCAALLPMLQACGRWVGPCGEVPLCQQCPCGKALSWEKRSWGSAPVGKRPCGKVLLWEIAPVGKCSCGKLSCRKVTLRDSAPVGKCLFPAWLVSL